jgi:tripartite-type tricarboxylate transporter receptor subunit TctC
MTSFRAHTALLTFVMILGASCFARAAGIDVTEFYTGKTITFIVGSANHSFARTIGRHMVKYVPGNPSMKFEMMPGRGSRHAAAAISKLSPGDGLAIAALLPEAIMDPLIGEQGIKRNYDPLELMFLGSASNSTYVCIADSEAPAKNFEQALQRPMIMGAIAAGGSSRDSTLMLMNLLGAKFKLVDGYRDRAQVLEALEHGEIQGLCGYSWSRLKRQSFDLITDNKVNLLLQFGLDGHSELTRLGVPSVWKFVKNKRDRGALGLLASSLVFARPFVASPGTPRAQVNALRVAFERTMRDVDFRSDAHKNQLNISPTTGEALQRLIKKIFDTPPDIVTRAREARKG